MGHATPQGTKKIVEFAKTIIHNLGETVGIDWHGHCDRGMALANTVTAIETGHQEFMQPPWVSVNGLVTYQWSYY